MTSFRTPGGYVDETSKFPPSVTTVETSIAVFIGYTETAATDGVSLKGIPTAIESFADYQSKFKSGISVPAAGYYLPASIQLFYENGGGRCYVVSAGDFTEAITFNALKAALEESRNISAQLIVIPDAVSLTDAAEFGKLQDLVLQMCSDLHRFAILDTLRPTVDLENDITSFRNTLGNNNLKFGAAYYPWLKLNDSSEIPPSGAIAGIYAYNDNTRGVWTPPANISLQGVAAPNVTFDSSFSDYLNVDVITGKSVNAIRVFADMGTLVWGARTLSGNSLDWRYISVCRLFLMIEDSIMKACAPFTFEPNDANTWTQIQAMIENFFIGLWKQGALAGAKPEESFNVQVGLGTTMTEQDVAEGRMNIAIRIAALHPAEFIELTIALNMRPA